MNNEQIYGKLLILGLEFHFDELHKSIENCLECFIDIACVQIIEG